jgi:hypothetical protein
MASTAGAQTLTFAILARPARGPGSAGTPQRGACEASFNCPITPVVRDGEQTTESQKQLARRIDAKKAAYRTYAAFGKRAVRATTTRDHDLFIMGRPGSGLLHGCGGDAGVGVADWGVEREMLFPIPFCPFMQD